ncbi:MAG: right-handed parallel beta-helix repeat-containing protein [Candidatus Binatus sp.]|uniref:right-handed parallel beta-helix repeat-containing protein n=2 Tax=Candidatus Binatus sp. TaxID=2811406 RepID=UPI003BB1C291
MPEPSITNCELTGHPEVPPVDEGLFEMRNRATLRFPWILPILATTAGLMMPAAASAQTACPPTINSCGCSIVKSGSYKIGLAIDSTQGLTPAGACIEIASSFVILDGGKKNITGPGGTSPTGIGVWVHAPFRSDFLEFRGSVISGFDIGLLIQSRQTVADDVTANTNGTAGVELFKAEDIELTNTTAENNLNYGIWLRQTSVSDVTNSKTESNGDIGLYVGCSAIGPTSSGCGGGPSPGNYIFTGNIQANANYGVALDIGAKDSIVTNQVLSGGTHNPKDDLFDANSSCGSNKWFANDSTATNNQPGGCIK